MTSVWGNPCGLWGKSLSSVVVGANETRIAYQGKSKDSKHLSTRMSHTRMKYCEAKSRLGNEHVE